MKQLYLATKKFLRDEDGVTMIEYALIAALIAVAVIATVTLVKDALDAKFKEICTKLGGTTCS